MTSQSGPSPEGFAFHHLLVPLDGSRLAEAVLPAASEMAKRFSATLTLLHVLERGAPPTVHGESHLVDPEDAAAYLSVVCERLAAGGVEAEAHVHLNPERDVAGSIVGHAAELGCDLIVLATHGGGRLRDVIVGSIAQQVIHRGLTPVLLLRPEQVRDGQPFAVERLLVPLDGTHDSERVLPVAVAVARAFRARVLLVRVVPNPENLPSEQAAVGTILPSATAMALDLEQGEALRFLGDLVDALKAQGVSASGEVSRGDPVAEIPESARRNGVDLAVIGTHGRAGLDAFWSGSIGSKLIQRLAMPILILRSNRPAR